MKKTRYMMLGIVFAVAVMSCTNSYAFFGAIRNAVTNIAKDAKDATVTAVTTSIEDSATIANNRREHRDFFDRARRVGVEVQEGRRRKDGEVKRTARFIDPTTGELVKISYTEDFSFFKMVIRTREQQERRELNRQRRQERLQRDIG